MIVCLKENAELKEAEVSWLFTVTTEFEPVLPVDQIHSIREYDCCRTDSKQTTAKRPTAVKRHQFEMQINSSGNQMGKA